MSSNFQVSYTALATRAAEEHMPARAGLCPEPKWDLRAEKKHLRTCVWRQLTTVQSACMTPGQV